MGLSKPIIIQDSSVDISNLATKSDLTTLANTVTSSVGAVKSVQRGLCSSAQNFNNITISAVNIDKSIAFCPANADRIVKTSFDDSAAQTSGWVCRLTKSTNLQLYREYTNVNYSVPWVVIEFK